MDLKTPLFIFLWLFVKADSDSECMTDMGKGQCVVLKKCDILMSRLTESKRDKNIFEILKRYNCGYDGNDPKVCCPSPDINMFIDLTKGKDCITPHGEGGSCKKLEDCRYINNQIQNKEFVLEENMEFIKRSKCTVPGITKSTYVCCKLEVDDRVPIIPYQEEDKCSLTAFPPNPESGCCGIESSSDSRIIGGKEAAIDQFPWLVMIEYTRLGYSCGGSLISGKYVLTAAHCLVGSKGRDRSAISVRIGEYNTTNPGSDCVEIAGGGLDCTDGDISVPIESYKVHEGYDADQVLQYNDIALIRLKETVNYTDFIRPICLPSSDFTKSPADDLDFLNFFIAGWGIFDETQQHSSDIKLYAKVPYVRKEHCNLRYSKLGRSQQLADTQLCVGGEANRDSCKGDSGGPLMFLKNFTYEITGVVSFGTKTCGLENWPSIYVKVYDYLDWIRAEIKP